MRTSKKPIGLISKTTTLHVHHTFLYICFPFLHDYDVKMPQNSRFMEDVNKQRRNCISLSELEYDHLKFPFRSYIWQSKWVGKITITTVITQIHFLSNVLVAVASLDFKVPNRAQGSLWFGFFVFSSLQNNKTKWQNPNWIRPTISLSS